MSLLLQSRQKKAKPCHCAAYRFPHRQGAGQCKAYDGAIFCEACALPCSSHTEDHGYGWTEAWGHVSNHVQLVEVSDCCEAAVCDDPRDIPKTN